MFDFIRTFFHQTIARRLATFAVIFISAWVFGFFAQTPTTYAAPYCMNKGNDNGRCIPNFNFKTGNPVAKSFIVNQPLDQRYWVQQNVGAPLYCVTKNGNKKCVESLDPPTLEMTMRGATEEAGVIPITFRLRGATDSYWYSRDNTDHGSGTISQFLSSAGGLNGSQRDASLQFCPCVVTKNGTAYSEGNTAFHNSCDVKVGGLNNAFATGGSPNDVCYDVAWVQVNKNGDHWIDTPDPKQRYLNHVWDGASDSEYNGPNVYDSDHVFQHCWGRGGESCAPIDRCGDNKNNQDDPNIEDTKFNSYRYLCNPLDCDNTRAKRYDYRQCYDEYTFQDTKRVNSGDGPVYDWRYRLVTKVPAFKMEQLLVNGSSLYTPGLGMARIEYDYEMRYHGDLLPNTYDAIETGSSVARTDTTKHDCNTKDGFTSITNGSDAKGSYYDYTALATGNATNSFVNSCFKDTVTNADCKNACSISCPEGDRRDSCNTNCDKGCKGNSTLCKQTCSAVHCSRQTLDLATKTINPTAGLTCRTTLISPLGVKSSYVYYTGSSEIPAPEVSFFKAEVYDDILEQLVGGDKQTSYLDSINIERITDKGVATAKVTPGASPNKSIEITTDKDKVDVVLSWSTKSANRITLRKDDNLSDQIEINKNDLSGSRTWKDLAAGHTYSFTLIAQNDRADILQDARPSWVKAQKIQVKVIEEPFALTCKPFTTPDKKDTVIVNWKATRAERFQITGRTSYFRNFDFWVLKKDIKNRGEGSKELQDIDQDDADIHLKAISKSGEEKTCDYKIQKTVGFGDMVGGFENGIWIGGTPLPELIPGVHCSYLVVDVLMDQCRSLSIHGLINTGVGFLMTLITPLLPGIAQLADTVLTPIISFISTMVEGSLGLAWEAINDFVLHHYKYDGSDALDVVINTIKGAIPTFIGSVIGSFLGDSLHCIDSVFAKIMSGGLDIVGKAITAIGDGLGEISKYVPGMDGIANTVKWVGGVMVKPPSANIISAIDGGIRKLEDIAAPTATDGGYFLGAMAGQAIGSSVGDGIARDLTDVKAHPITGPIFLAAREGIKNVVLPAGQALGGNKCGGNKSEPPPKQKGNWTAGNWGACTQNLSECPAWGTKTRTVTCSTPDVGCIGEKPEETIACTNCVGPGKVGPGKPQGPEIVGDLIVNPGHANTSAKGFGLNVYQKVRAIQKHPITEQQAEDAVPPKRAKAIAQYVLDYGVPTENTNPTTQQQNVVMCIAGGDMDANSCRSHYDPNAKKITK